MQSAVISPVVAPDSIEGIAITFQLRAGTLRSRGTSARLPVIMPSLPCSNHFSAEWAASSSSVSVTLGLRNSSSAVCRALWVPSPLNARDVGSLSSSNRSPPPAYTNGAMPGRVGSTETPLVPLPGREANFAAVTNSSQFHRRGSPGTSSPRASMRAKSMRSSL